MTPELAQSDLPSIVAWLVEGAHDAHAPEQVLGGKRLVKAGLPLHRVAMFVRTLHPDIMGRRLLWRAGEEVSINEVDYTLLDTPTYRESPVRVVFALAQPIRRKVEDPHCLQDYPIVEELRAEGVSDYIIHPLPMTSGQVDALSWTTTRQGGFTDADLAALDAVRLPLARLVEVHSLRRTATTLLDTYVGQHAGGRILQGNIRRGDIERIEAVIMLTDLRGFTTLSNELPGDQVIGLLNGYFDCLVPSIDRQGGEVLKLIGDGLLAIFPVAVNPAAACRTALAAARQAQDSIDASNAARAGSGQPILRHGMALHLGDVLYGNIGSTGRLDFTATGPAVNLTARLETLAGDLGRALVVSAGFARHSPEPLESLGSFRLRGFREPQEVFAPRFNRRAGAA